jgi:formate hydrogenlyase transcriptional activator
MPRSTRRGTTVALSVGAVCRVVSLALLSFVTVPIHAQAPEPPRSILLLGNRDYAPLSFLAEDTPRGIDVEVVQAIAAVLGRDIRVGLTDWNAAREQVLRGSADGLIDLGLSDERLEQWDFTEPTVTHEFRLFVRSGELVIRDVLDLPGRRVGVAPGGFPAEFLKTQGGVTLVPMTSYDDGFDRLLGGEIDAVAADEWVAAYTIQQRGLTGIATAGEPFATLPAGIAIRKGNPQLVADMNRAIKMLKADGTLAIIQARWRPQEVVFLSRERIQQVVLLWGGAIGLVFAIGMAAWVVTLKKQIRVRRQTEAALQESTRLLNLTLSAAEMGTWRWVVAENRVTRDASMNRMLGLVALDSVHTLEESFTAIHPDDQAATKTEFERAIREKNSYSAEFRMRMPDGSFKWVRGQGKPFFDDRGELESVSGAVIDITSAKVAQEAIRASEERFAKAFEASPDCIALSDFNGILEINQRFEEMTGYPRSEIIGRNIADFGLLVDPSQRQRVLDTIREKGSIRDFEFQFRRKNGDIGTVLLSSEAIEIGGRPCFLSVTRDVTHQKQLEANLQRASEINRLLVSELEPDALYAAVTQSLGSLVRIDYASLVLYERSSKNLQLRAHTFFDSRGVNASEHQLPRGRTPASVTIEGGRVTIFTRAELEAFGEGAAPLLAEGLRTLCGVPLDGRHGALGVLGVGSRTDHAFSEADLQVLKQLSTYVAIAVENAQTYEEVQQLKNQLAEEKLYLEEEIRVDHNFADIIGSSPALKRVLKQIETVAPTESTVLLLGETGTGKELLARALHERSSRRERTFVRVNAAALPSTLLESELFGYERGAFTGAVTSKVGRFELAHRGTLFLDEVGDIPLEIQPKLLRILQEREFERLGSTKTQRADVRLIGATNRDLEAMSADGTFRSDLYYRLNVFPIHVPPLRDRPDDIPLLVRHFVQRFSAKLKRRIETIPAPAMSDLQAWHWPGNIRELENVIERAVIVSPGPVLQVPVADLTPAHTAPHAASPAAPHAVHEAADVRASADRSARGTFADSEREMILRALREANGVIAGEEGAAARLGLKRTTLQSKMRKLGIRRPTF